MKAYCSNIDSNELLRIIGTANRITVTTHAKPDGDAFGAVVATTVALRQLGKSVQAWFMPPLSNYLGSLNGAELVQMFNANDELGSPDLLILLDTGASAQVQPMYRQLEALLDHTLIVDHHLSGDLSARWRFIDNQAAACCEMVLQILDRLEVGLDDRLISQALFVGIASDTGWFRFSNTRPLTHEMAARLLRSGVDHAELYARVQQNERPQKLALMSRALTNLDLLADGRVALMVLRPTDFLETGADHSDVEQFVDIPQVVSAVQTVVLISQGPPEDKHPPLVRISFRSKPGLDAINVAELAREFGGGGHARAAGAKIPGQIDQVIERVTQALTRSN